MTPPNVTQRHRDPESRAIGGKTPAFNIFAVLNQAISPLGPYGTMLTQGRDTQAGGQEKSDPQPSTSTDHTTGEGP